MNATRILLIRHGETDWNRDARIQGQTDVPLNALGRAQALRLADRLRREGIQEVYSSDLSRVLDTARTALNGSGLEIRASPDFREASFGLWEGRRWSDLEREYPKEVSRYWSEYGRFAPPGGESLTDVGRRCAPAFREIQRQHTGRTVALFTHGGPCRMILALALELDVNRVRRLGMSNASVHVVEVNGSESQVLLLNDTGHLDGPCAPLAVFKARIAGEN